MCVEAEGCSEDTTVQSKEVISVEYVRVQVSLLSRKPVFPMKTGQAEISWRHFAEDNKRADGNRTVLDRRIPCAAHGVRSEGFYAGLHAEKTSGLIYAE